MGQEAYHLQTLAPFYTDRREEYQELKSKWLLLNHCNSFPQILRLNKIFKQSRNLVTKLKI